MDKVKLIRILRQRTYWEKERDKCFFNIFLWPFLAIVIAIKTNYLGIKKIKEIGWSNADGWDKFSGIFDWMLVIVFVIHFLVFIYYILRIQTCSHKLIHLNSQLLAELSSLPDEA